MPLYEEKLINPLAVRFSQDRIWPDFQDGTRIDDSLKQIGSVAVQGCGYDLVLRPPFPPMEIIRLKQERREADGERSRDEKGRRLYGEESWFTFDNRRLYCLQRAALEQWPNSVAVVVKVLFDFPAVRCARHKFRTTTDGCAVKISLPDGQPGALWNWYEAARAAHPSCSNTAYVMDAVRRDSGKTSKEMLTDVPPIALLSPGTRETTVAERFNLGALHAGPAGSNGQSAGMQLLSFIQGKSDGASGGLGGLFAQPAPAAQSWPEEAWQEEAWQEEAWEEESYAAPAAKGRSKGGKGGGKGSKGGAKGAKGGGGHGGHSGYGGAKGAEYSGYVGGGGGGGYGGGEKGAQRRRPKGGGKGDTWQGY